MNPHTFACEKVGMEGERTIYRINTSKARYFDTPWKELGEFGKRKFENMVVLMNGGLVKVVYA